MNNLTTPIIPEPGGITLNYGDRVLLMGSCFTDNIGAHLEAAAFDVLCNPFGILYNPSSIAMCLQHCVEATPITAADLVQQQGQWHSWLHHSGFSRPTPQETLRACNEALYRAHHFLEGCTTLIVTFGTANVYRLKHDGRVVGNCHKVPQQQFIRQRLAVDDIVGQWQQVIFQLPRGIQKVVFTVSPIRHWKDGAHEDQLSKSTLLLAIDRLVGRRAGHTIGYFPSYELMMDELRDYRFYADDMLHPSSLAVDIIWQRFLSCYMGAATQQIVNKAEQLHKMQQHRPLFPDSHEYRAHQARTTALERELQELIACHRKEV